MLEDVSTDKPITSVQPYSVVLDNRKHFIFVSLSSKQ